MNTDNTNTTSQQEDWEDEIQFLNEEYRAGRQLVTDAQYDAKLAMLAKVYPDSHLLKKNILEQAPITRKRKLHTQMMSLDKLKTVAEVKAWLKSLGVTDSEMIIITPKYNGISLENNTELSTASTRGDGEYGQDCDAHYRMMRSYEALDPAVFIGEAIISRSNWDNHFKGKVSPKGLPYKLNNATVSGLLNNDTPTEELQHVDFIRYGIVSGENSDIDKLLQLQYINDKCLVHTNYCSVSVGEIDEDLFDLLFLNWNKAYPIDGLVIDINRYTLRSKLGRETNGNPVYAKALKLDKWTEEFDTTITGHSYTISKQGKLKGVVTFEPVIINGTEVKQATFNNARFLRDFFLSKDTNITVKKSGEVIPKIVAVEGIRIPLRNEFKKESDFTTAYNGVKDSLREYFSGDPMKIAANGMTCPSCGMTLQWDTNGVELECWNEFCDSMRVSKLEHFFLSIGIEEFGRPSIQILSDAGYKTPEVIMWLDKNIFANIPGFGESSVEIIQSQFRKIMESGIPMARLMYAYDVFEGKIGESTAQLILDHSNQFDLTKQNLVTIKGVSDITADCFIKGLQAFAGTYQFIPISYTVTPVKVASSDRYLGMAVCFSGVRDAGLEELIKDGGGKIASGVSKNTTHLVVADPNQSTGKTVDARKLGIPILTIEQFKSL
jgi:DNA ligase (NAD+)